MFVTDKLFLQTDILDVLKCCVLIKKYGEVLRHYVWATDRSLMAKKADGIKESTDSNTTIEEEETRG